MLRHTHRLLAVLVVVAACGGPAAGTAPSSSIATAAGPTGTPARTAVPFPSGGRSTADVLAYLRSVGDSSSIIVGQHFTQGTDASDPRLRLSRHGGSA
jgi:hypothetical protein